MELISEEIIEQVRLEFDLTKEEMVSLIYYADKTIQMDKLNELKIEWAVNDILEKALEDDQEPCDHPGCARHHSHPCEKCGKIQGEKI